MKFKCYKAVLIGMLLSINCLVNLASAGIINSDYLSDGDGLAVYDEESGLKWLDLSLSVNMTRAQVELLDSDYRFANKNELQGLFNKLFPHFIETPNFLGAGLAKEGQYPEMNEELDEWFSLFGYTGLKQVSYGFYFDTDNHRRLMGAVDYRRAGYNIDPTQRVISPDYEAIYDSQDDRNIIGYYLVKKIEVPEPSTIAIFALGLMGLGLRRRSKV